jgi:DNA-binding transcriptional LysR family regulator
MLDSGEIEFALYVTLNVKGDFIVQKLFDERYILVMRNGHPLLNCLPEHGAFEPEDLDGFPQIEFSYPTQEHLRAEVGHVSSVFSVPFFTVMPFIIDGIQTVPYRPSSGFPYHLIWHERARHNPAIRWFVEQVVAAMK